MIKKEYVVFMLFIALLTFSVATIAEDLSFLRNQARVENGKWVRTLRSDIAAYVPAGWKVFEENINLQVAGPIFVARNEKNREVKYEIWIEMIDNVNAVRTKIEEEEEMINQCEECTVIKNQVIYNVFDNRIGYYFEREKKGYLIITAYYVEDDDKVVVIEFVAKDKDLIVNAKQSVELLKFDLPSKYQIQQKQKSTSEQVRKILKTYYTPKEHFKSLKNIHNKVFVLSYVEDIVCNNQQCVVEYTCGNEEVFVITDKQEESYIASFSKIDQDIEKLFNNFYNKRNPQNTVEMIGDQIERKKEVSAVINYVNSREILLIIYFENEVEGKRAEEEWWLFNRNGELIYKGSPLGK